MNFMDLLQNIQNFGGVLVNEDFALGICYSKRFNVYLWCFKNGKAVEDKSSVCGYKVVILSPHLFRDDWKVLVV